MFTFIKNILKCCIGSKKGVRKQEYEYYSRPQAEGNRFILNKDL